MAPLPNPASHARDLARDLRDLADLIEAAIPSPPTALERATRMGWRVIAGGAAAETENTQPYP